MGYEIKIASYCQQMDDLQERQRKLKATAGRFAEVKYWMAAFREHVHSGKKMDNTDAVVLPKSPIESWYMMTGLKSICASTE